MFESFDNIHFVIQTIPIFDWEHDLNASTSVTINLSTPLDIRSRSKSKTNTKEWIYTVRFGAKR